MIAGGRMGHKRRATSSRAAHAAAAAAEHALPPPAGGTTSGLHVSGDKSLNGSGQQVRLHGADFSSFGKGNSSVLFKPYDEPHDLAWACWRDGGCTVTGSQRGARSPC
jgi:hypothetical protein